MKALLLLILSCLLSSASPLASSLAQMLEGQMDELEKTYTYLHSHPELSYHEKETAGLIADRLRSLGFTVATNVGDYRVEGRMPYGLVGVLENGTGPTVMVRTDMDALPVEENTGLPYTSDVKVQGEEGTEVGVMHACGHDVHMTCFLGTARLLTQLSKDWHGTLVMIAQPAEERGAGAKAMLLDGLYERFSKPDFALALHASASLVAGTVGYCPEYSLANVDSVDITVRGRSGHGAYPHATKDPVVLAAQIILALQTISSRIISPLDPVVVTVGSVHGGTKHNIIPDEVRLQLTVRSYKAHVRKAVLESIRNIALNTARAAGIPDDLLPLVSEDENEYTPSMYNDPELTAQMAEVFAEELGKERVIRVEPVMAGEDFSRYALEDRQIPSLLFWLGSVDPAKANRVPLPPLHSSAFAPSPRLTIQTGVRAMTAAVLHLMERGR